MKILILGDIVGRPGRTAVINAVPRLREELGLDLVIANGENASGGLGLSAKSYRALSSVVDVMTTGNHIWKFGDIWPVLKNEPRLLRPANYPEAPGRGFGVYEFEGLPPIAVVNIQGRTFMPPIDCPFLEMDKIMEEVPEDAVIIVDFHAEATSEKIAMGFMLDGRITALVGTHTHIQTNDARLLPEGTAYLTDLGMCGPFNSSLGMEPDPIVKRFRTGLPARFTVKKNTEVRLTGALLEVDDSTRKAVSIEPWLMDIE
ncbi:MAG: TIGR00282 family metallophosphoesterase [Desulfovibrio sp.]